uniref:Chromo domain-containing protein n=1 Tax=Angiostrongylus cantonensis TaxID=6313 RepID=A0A0K0CX23_ANGCA
LSWAAIPERSAPTKPMKKEIPPHAKALSGSALVEYVRKNQPLFEIDHEAAVHELRTKVMKPKFIDQKKNPLVEYEDDVLEIPERQVSIEAIFSLWKNFDARTQWPHCPSLSYIRDQSDCGDNILFYS